MHVLIAGLYAVVIYLSLLAYVIITGLSVVTFLAVSPLVISGAMVVIFALDYAVRGVEWCWRQVRPLVRN